MTAGSTADLPDGTDVPDRGVPGSGAVLCVAKDRGLDVEIAGCRIAECRIAGCRIGDLRIADCRAEDVAALESAMPAGTAHATHYAMSLAGARSYVLAWLGAEPVGTAVVLWAGFHEQSNREALPGVPEICSVHVAEQARGRGIGTALITRAERRIAARGFPRAGIGVADDNPRALALYARLGYTGTGLRTTGTYPWTDVGGKSHEATETDAALVKDLERD